MAFTAMILTGVVLITLSALDTKVNQTAIRITLEVIKYGGFIFLITKAAQKFL